MRFLFFISVEQIASRLFQGLSVVGITCWILIHYPSVGSIVSVAVDRADVTGRRRDREVDLHLTFFRRKGCKFLPLIE